MIKATVKLDISKENIEADLLGAVDKAFGDNADRGFQLSQELILKQSFDEGTLLRSGHIIKTGELERVISYEAIHALYIEFGREPSDKLPPFDAIFGWVQRKKIGKPKERQRITWAIMQDIKKHGLEARPFARPMAAELEAHIEGDVRNRIKEVVK